MSGLTMSRPLTFMEQLLMIILTNHIMNNKQFLAELSKRCNLSVTETEKNAEALINVMESIWHDGDSVNLSGFGLLGVRKKKERVSVSPSTGVKMLVPPKLVLTYKPSLVLKEKVNTKNYGEEV